ncbi:TetR/AcrR family transcriptional regulator [Pseudoteredinibacter isoporae]|uniref:DNA-binding transcriptional regulator YbjK n=1 Tax=Pseudoteredinibacter isoporae TaxID=570281 RepID=A0A7X0JUS5_9GAMM|nr:TetR family transcriptional regulator [Pseudoteredinibacter isoporae]MBB6522083.1 DNA-binding transcriptional regulator YbjK [Pseudoteredinibacter isoporae]NHO87618.1 TetR family transcriptional regulator [Pseudoteredinibacter isoporae]NIB24051.1 TetR family transcriptional regulator [Pseudoteredinibacter isoporae]
MAGEKDSEKQDLAIEIKGRQPRRANSRHRRREILEATLRIIARDGIRSVRHRAIAKEAEVPLSATTYYFKDIKDLINDAFGLFIEESQVRNAWLKEQTFALYQNKLATRGENTLSPELLESLSIDASTLVLEHIRRQVDDVQSRRLEHAFLNETLHNRSLEEKYQVLRGEILQAIQQFLELLGNDAPEADAHSLHGIIQWLEYLLVVENCPENWQLAESTLQRHIQRLFSPIEK